MSFRKAMDSETRRTSNQVLRIVRRHERQQRAIPLSATLTGMVMFGALWVFLQLVSCVQPSLLH